MPHDDEMVDLVAEVAGAALGFADLRPGQETAAAAVVAGRDVLAVMPTGAGKSAVYQIAGALVPGATVVVSPLIALQQDQVAAIGDDLGGARQVNSSMSEVQRRETFPPESLDAYYQEFGRAGRDNEPASAVLFRSRQSAGGRRFFAGTAELPVDVLATVAEATQAATEPIPIASLAAVVKASASRLAVAVDRLQRVGAVELDGEGCVAWTGTASVDELVDQAAADHARYRTTDRTRAEMMQRYLETEQCRWRTILGYFGDPSAENCGHCDNCDAGIAPVDTTRHHDELFPLGARVVHATFGAGEVVACESGAITVLFDDAGYRNLSVDLVRENQLLTPA